MPVVRDFTAILSGATINGVTGQGAFYSFSFPVAVPEYLRGSYSSQGLASFQPFNAEAQAQARAAIAAFGEASGITFFEVAPSEGDIKFMAFEFDALPSDAAGFAYYPDSGYGSPLSSDIFIDLPYTRDLGILLHELGHALGLKHPFDGEITLATDLDNFSNTVLSYTSGGFARTGLGPFDVQAIQHLYGTPAMRGTQVANWSWDAPTLTLTQAGTAGDDRLFGIGGSDIIDGGDGNDIIVGREGTDRLSGGAGDDVLRGGLGHSILSGGTGADRFEIEASGTTLQLDVDGGDGVDNIQISASQFTGQILSLRDAAVAGRLINVESITVSFFNDADRTVVGSDINDNIFGWDGNDWIDGADGNDFIAGGGGSNIIFGGSGSDTAALTLGDSQAFHGGSGQDNAVINAARGITELTISADQLEFAGVTLSGVESISINGTSGADRLSAGAMTGSVVLSGADGNDVIDGGTGSGGSLFGNGGDDVIVSGTGAHFVYGGAGADRFVFVNAASSTQSRFDQLEDFQTGIDIIDLTGFALWNVRIQASGSSSYIYGDGLEGPFQLFVRTAVVASDVRLMTGQNPAIAGTAAADSREGSSGSDYLFGDGGDDILQGQAGNDLLDGGLGTDRLIGGVGNDSYYINVPTDLVFENSGQGTDTVFASGNFYLHAHVENLSLVGFGGFFGVGNELANVLTGNAGENLLIAGAGADIVRGGDARDAIFGEAGDDRLFGDAGVDYIVAGIGNDSADGGVDADEIYGQDGDDVLNGGTSFHTDILVGGAGNDTFRGDSGQGDFDFLYGNAGNDSFYVDTPADLVFEQAGEGIDTVFADINGAGFYLYDNIENLTLLGSTPFGVGNGLANTITGNAQANFLLGGLGNDILNGMGGGDVLFGEAGADLFVFGRGTGADVIGDFQRGVDRIDLTAFGIGSFAALQSMFVQDGNVGAILLGNGDLVVLHGVQMGQLVAGDFAI